MSVHDLLIEESHDLPLVHFQVLIPDGSLADPADKAGLTRLSARMMRRGTERRDTRVIEEAIDGLGAELSIETTPGFVRVGGSVIRRSLEPMLELVGEMLAMPSFPESELAQLKRETQAALVELTDSDQTLVGTHFRRGLYRGHPYARPIVGTRESIEAVTLDEVRTRYREGLRTMPRLVGLSGDITRAEAEALIAKHLPPQPRARERARPPEPTPRVGRHLVLVDKPERTQTQVQIGALGTHASDADHTALVVGNSVFGGAFTSRLMRAVRSERGWSYGASSRLGLDRVRESWSMWTFPAAGDALPCISLQLELMERWVEDGITDDELAFAKSYMIKSYAFATDTADKRLEQAIDVELYDLPQDYFASYTERVAAVTRDQVNQAVRARLSPSALVLCVVATEAEIGQALRRIPGLGSSEVVPFDVDT